MMISREYVFEGMDLPISISLTNFFKGKYPRRHIWRRKTRGLGSVYDRIGNHRS